MPVLKRKSQDGRRLSKINHKRAKRENEEFRNKERVKDKSYKAMKRQDEDVRNEKRLNDKSYKAAKRQDKDYRNQEKLKDKSRKMKQRSFDIWTDCKEEFLEKIKLGPTNICCCCGGLWFQDSIKAISVDLFVEKCKCVDVDDLIISGEYGDNQLFCNTCRTSILKNKVPTLAAKNGFMYPDVPDALKDLTSLEERLCALRLPFMQIRSLGVGKQYGLKGNVINVMNTIEDTASILPRRFNMSSIIQLQLMRRLEYKHAYLEETIRPAKVHMACELLCQTELYKEENVVLSDDWKDRLVDEVLPFIVDESDKINKEGKQEQERKDNASQDEDDPINPGGNETLLFNIDELCANQVIKYAPGENRRPMSLISDIHAEELAFPTIYCGQKRQFKNKVSYSDIAKSEARRYDRRGCLPHKLLYSYKVQTTHLVSNVISMCLRKKKSNSITAKELLNPETVNTMIQHNDGFKLLTPIRSSPAYWQNKQKNVMAMIRQLGIPTFFITLSAAETHWPELLVILKKVLDGADITELEAMDLPYAEKAELIRRDPITCARYFDWRFRLWKKYILLSQGGAFNNYKVIDFYFRVEFQHRGSPHIHGVIWLESAPKYKENSPESISECVNFIDEFISCQANVEGVIHQSHKHTTTCERKNRNGDFKCRFGMPYPPMKNTKIMTPLADDTPKTIKQKLILNFAKIQEQLNSIHKSGNTEISLEDFLLQINLDEKTYEMAIRSSLSRPTVFLRRNVNSVFENAYNEKIAKVWRSNMDIQFILDAYACVKYCISYIAKSCRGMSKLLKAAVDDVHFGNLSVKEKLRRIGNVFLNSTEISAQEAAYTILGMSLSMSSRDSVFISTGLPEDRIYMTKSVEDLKQLSPDSNKVLQAGLLDHYEHRPEELDQVCLADFAALYTFSSKSNKFYLNEDNEFQIFEDNLQAKCKLITYPLKNHTGFVNERSKARVIRFRRYNKGLDEDNYYREQVMLYMPWRDEQSELINHDKKALYLTNLQIITHNSRKYEIEKEFESIELKDEDITEDDEQEEIDEDGLIYDIEDNRGDIGLEMGMGEDRSKSKVFNLPNLLNDKDYYTLMRSLNNGQRRYMYHVLKKIKEPKNPWYNLVTGGAGTGKSFLIAAVVQSVTRHLNCMPGSNPSSIKILICAPTGKAACNVGGTTLHEAFCLPLNQFRGGMPKLSNDFCNTLASKLNDLKMIIIDEVSMKSLAMFYQVNERLQQIFNSKEFFGGISVLLVGDFHQLKPVAGAFVFSKPKGLATLAGNLLWEQFSLFELTQIMRQKDDLSFANALNRMATGNMTDEDIELLRGREIFKIGQPPSGTIRLFYDNASVEAFNRNLLKTLEGEEIIALARDQCKGRGKCIDAILESAKSLNIREAQGLPSLKIGVKYMITVNINVCDGLVNGATGVLKKIVYGTINGIRVPSHVFILFDNVKSGTARRQEYRRMCLKTDIEATWTPIVPVKKIIKNWEGRSLSVIRSQFPLVVAEAITVHKSQGGTLEAVVVKPSKWMTRAALYVACSRATKLTGLYIDGEFNPPTPACDNDPVENEMTRLRNNGMNLSYNVFDQLKDNTFNILFHNVQSLHAHYEDVKNDEQYQYCDVILFAETWSIPEDVYDIPNYSTIQRLDCGQRKEKVSKGIMAFINDNSTKNIRAINTVRHNCVNGVIEIGIISIEDVIIIYGYKSPKVSFKDLKESLLRTLRLYDKDQKICLIGDFNLELHTLEGKDLVESFGTWNITVKSTTRSFSTNLNTQIDVCLSSIDDIQTWYGESYWSFHKPLFVSIGDSDLQNVDEIQSSLKIMKLHESLKITKSSIPTLIETEAKQLINRNILRHDLRSLGDGEWLNDKIMNGYSKILADKLGNQNVHILNTFFFWRDKHRNYNSLECLFPSALKNLRELRRSVLYFPSMHIDHWFLLKLDVPAKVITIMDSLYGHVNMSDHINHLLVKLEELTTVSMYDWKRVNVFESEIQDNGFDCGCYTLYFLEKCLSANSMDLNEVNMRMYRKSIANAIVNQK